MNTDANPRPQDESGPPTIIEVAAWLKLFIEPDARVEIRAPRYKPAGSSRESNPFRRFSGRNLLRAAEEGLRLSEGAPGVYFTLNPVKPGLAPDHAANDLDIERRRLLLIDCDPVRPADSSATDSEKAAAHETMLAVGKRLKALGWPAPVVADSGNGWHALFRIDLAADDEGLVKAVLEALAARFDSPTCKIDTKVFNPSRICKLYGTIARKGENTAERPHRTSRVLKAPESFEPVPVELLQAVAADKPSAAQALDLEAEIERKRERSEAASSAVNGRPRQQGNRPDPETRALAYLTKCSPAISGSGGHGQAFKTACKVGPGFDLSPDDALRLLQSEYNPRCVPPWSDRELKHKVDEAYKVESRRGWLLDAERNGLAPSNNETGGNSNPPDSKPTPPSDGPETNRTRPTIILTHKLHEVVAEAVAAVALDPDVYQRGSSLVTMVRNAKPPRGMDGTEGAPQIVAAPVHRLLELMSRSAEWKRWGQNKSGENVLTPAAPSEKFARMVAERGCWPGVRPLEGVIEAPTIRPDGTILQTPGYDAETGLHFLPNDEFPPIPEQPSRKDAELAVARLIGLVCDFPFESDPHRYAWLCCVITDVARFAVNGPCPMFLFDANVSGSGKTKLCDVSAVIATGRSMPRSSYTANDAEMSKQLLSIALGGFRFVLFDNVQTGELLGGAALDKALTSRTLNDRILGSSRMSGDVPFHAVLHVTGNNLGLRGDALRRIVPVRLESSEERPEERRDFSIQGDLLDHVRRRRPALLADALTIVRAYVVAGRPERDLTPMDFPAWSGLIRNAVHWASGVDPCETRKARVADDESSAELAGLLQGWEALCAAEGKAALTASQAVQALESNPNAHEGLRALLAEWSKDAKLPSSRTVGNRLAKLKGKPSGGKAFAFTIHEGNRSWRVAPVRQSLSGDSGDSSGSSYNPQRNQSEHLYTDDVSCIGENQSHQSLQSHPTNPVVSYTEPGYENLF